MWISFTCKKHKLMNQRLKITPSLPTTSISSSTTVRLGMASAPSSTESSPPRMNSFNLHPSGRIIAFNIGDLTMTNIYLPSGAERTAKNLREDLCGQTIPNMMLAAKKKGMIGGDCITHPSDCTHHPEPKMSPNLKKTSTVEGHLPPPPPQVYNLLPLLQPPDDWYRAHTRCIGQVLHMGGHQDSELKVHRSRLL